MHRSPIIIISLLAPLPLMLLTLLAYPTVLVATVAAAGGVLDDDVPREKAKMPKLKPRV